MPGALIGEKNRQLNLSFSFVSQNIIYTTIGEPYSKFEVFQAVRPQFDRDHGVDFSTHIYCQSATFVRPLFAFYCATILPPSVYDSHFPPARRIAARCLLVRTSLFDAGVSRPRHRRRPRLQQRVTMTLLCAQVSLKIPCTPL